MKLAVTGGSGFIGSHVVDCLVEEGHDVVVLDSAVRSHNEDAKYVETDILDLDGLTRALRGCEMVFHLAGVSNVDHAYEQPVRTVRVNTGGTANVCEAARTVGAHRVILASTVWVYGAAVPGAQLKEDVPIQLADAGHVYTSSKLAAEMLLHSYREMYGLPFTILRYGIPYGPRMRDELVIARFVQRALRGEPLTIAGDGRQVRRYVYVRDLADAHLRTLKEAAANEVFALEGADPVSIRRIAETVRDVVAKDVTIEHVPARPADYSGREVSNEKARRLLGWQPRTSFDDGLREYVQWYLSTVADEDLPARASEQ